MDRQKIFALTLGIFLTVLGISGFIDNSLVGDNGYFRTNIYLDILNILLGSIGIYFSTKNNPIGFNRVIGWTGLVFGAIYFIPGIDDLFIELLNVNLSINILYLIIGITALSVYYFGKK